MEKNLETFVLELAKISGKRADFEKAKTKISSKLKINQPSNRGLFKIYRALVKENTLAENKTLEKYLTKAEIRNLSGIAVITSLVKPYACPGKCVYCPTEVRMPKSYIASEPAAARAERLDFSPYRQMRERILMLEQNGHAAEKIEFIIKGGTWNAYPIRYQYWFMLESFRAANEAGRANPPSAKLMENSPLTELKTALAREQTKNETSGHRLIGVTLETRPDAISAKSIYDMRQQGATRIELGLQAPDDRILELIQRGHTVDQFRSALKLLRQVGFKVDLHFMPDLPGTTPKHDVEMYQSLFSDKSLRPDMVKIYPNTVIPSAELYQWYKEGKYKPYGDKALFDALLQMKKSTPRYCRISRLIRDIPANEIVDGNKITNLREELEKTLKNRGEKCVCLRCREIGRHRQLSEETPILFTENYSTDGGQEWFLTFEDKSREAVFAFLRLRLPDSDGDRLTREILPETAGTAFVRELHTYGAHIKINENTTDQSAQHRGLGKKLMREAEKIALNAGFSKLAVISGVGVRGYYRKLGYRLNGSYMIKRLAKKAQKR